MKKIIITWLCVILVSLWFYPNETITICIGAIWGYINLYFIKQLLFNILIAAPKNWLKISIIVFIKFPICYTLGYALLLIDKLYAWGLLIGFSLALVTGIHRLYWNSINTAKET